MTAAAFLARWRVRVGYPLALVVLWFARPSPQSILVGTLVGIAGLLLRASAAGHLRKHEQLSIAGPYAYTRNPLYLGSAILALATAIAARSWISAGILLVYFGVFYSVVMKKEEVELRQSYGRVFEEYERNVPLFVPRLAPAKSASGEKGSFAFEQYKKNREYQAAVGFLLLLAVLLAIWRLRGG